MGNGNYGVDLDKTLPLPLQSQFASSLCLASIFITLAGMGGGQIFLLVLCWALAFSVLFFFVYNCRTYLFVQYRSVKGGRSERAKKKKKLKV
jgi:hypothetical protein